MSADLIRVSQRNALRAVCVVSLLLGWALYPLSSARAERLPPALGMLTMVNDLRAVNGLAALTEAQVLDDIAADRSADMAARQYFSHTTPERVTVFDTMNQLRLDYRIAAENLAYVGGRGDQDALNDSFDAVVKSPHHLDNMLGRDFTQIGVGAANQGGRTYFTLVFLG